MSLEGLYLHGFLGNAEDFRPLFLNEDSRALDLEGLIKNKTHKEVLSHELENYDFVVAYSFGGRLLEEALKFKKNKNLKKVFFISSRHSPYTAKELEEREGFRKKLKSLLKASREDFDTYWESLKLFSSHSMKSYRQLYNLSVAPWSDESVDYYLDHFFNSEQCPPIEDSRIHYIVGETDVKYVKESQKLPYKVKVFKGLGHRLCFENPDLIKAHIQEVLGV